MCAVLIHVGNSIYSGHYYCYVKVSNNEWYCFNDDSVKKVEESEVLKQSPYLLFYEKVLDIKRIGFLKSQSASKIEVDRNKSAKPLPVKANNKNNGKSVALSQSQSPNKEINGYGDGKMKKINKLDDAVLQINNNNHHNSKSRRSNSASASVSAFVSNKSAKQSLLDLGLRDTKYNAKKNNIEPIECLKINSKNSLMKKFQEAFHKSNSVSNGNNNHTPNSKRELRERK